MYPTYMYLEIIHHNLLFVLILYVPVVLIAISGNSNFLQTSILPGIGQKFMRHHLLFLILRPSQQFFNHVGTGLPGYIEPVL